MGFSGRFVRSRENSFVLSLFVVVVVVVEIVSGIPIPPRQNVNQSVVYEKVATEAIVASNIATPLLLTIFDSQEFREEISSIPQLSNATSQEVLQLFRQLIISSSQSHNFPISTTNGLDVTLPEMIQNGFLANYYTGIIEGYLQLFPPLYLEETYAETKFFGYPPFANFSNPTLPEALTRPQYSCLNIYDVAGGCVFYGDLSLVLSKRWANNLTILSPTDTGFYVGCCINTSTTTFTSHLIPSSLPSLLNRDKRGASRKKEGLTVCPGSMLEVNCSAWDEVPGTLNNFDHILLANSGFLGIPLSTLLLRYFQPQTFPSSPFELLSLFLGYFEGNIAGAIPFPEGVSHLEAGTSQLLGREGEESYLELLRNWTMENSWPLVWTSGLALSNNQTTSLYFSFDDVNMFLDPFSVTLTTNLTSDQLGLGNLTASREFFEKMDQVAQVFLEENPVTGIGNATFWKDLFATFLTGIDPGLLIRYPRIDECDSDSNNDCFAVQLTTDSCICKQL